MEQALKTDQVFQKPGKSGQDRWPPTLPPTNSTGSTSRRPPSSISSAIPRFRSFPFLRSTFSSFRFSLRTWGRRPLSDGCGWYRGSCPLPLWECPRLFTSGAEVVDCPPWPRLSASFLPLRSSLLQRGEEFPPPCEERPGIGLPRPGWFI